MPGDLHHVLALQHTMHDRQLVLPAQHTAPHIASTHKGFLHKLGLHFLHQCSCTLVHVVALMTHSLISSGLAQVAWQSDHGELPNKKIQGLIPMPLRDITEILM